MFVLLMLKQGLSLFSSARKPGLILMMIIQGYRFLMREMILSGGRKGQDGDSCIFMMVRVALRIRSPTDILLPEGLKGLIRLEGRYILRRSEERRECIHITA